MTADISAARLLRPLTRRESEVARLVSYGLRNAQIATQLGISERTVEAHLHNSYARLKISTRSALAVWASRR